MIIVNTSNAKISLFWNFFIRSLTATPFEKLSKTVVFSLCGTGKQYDILKLHFFQIASMDFIHLLTDD